MKVQAQICMVINLDKCIGCHTCSVTCKNVWTSRKGMEYAWFNNVETKPGIGYPKKWEDQEKWQGGWEVKDGKAVLRHGNRPTILGKLFSSPRQPEVKDYLHVRLRHPEAEPSPQDRSDRASVLDRDRQAHGQGGRRSELGR